MLAQQEWKMEKGKWTPVTAAGQFRRSAARRQPGYILKSSLSRRVCARDTGISLARLSFILSM